MTKQLAFVCFLFISIAGFSQENEKSKSDTGAAEKSAKGVFSYNIDLVNRYYWRGMDIDNSPAVQPEFTYSWNNGIKFGFWGTFGFKQMKETIDNTVENYGHYAEFDPFISYTRDWFSIELNDYFTVSTIGESAYFNLKKSETGHSGVMNITMGGTKKFPLFFTASTVLYGADLNRDKDGVWGMGTRNNYSSYIELQYPINIKKIGLEIAPEIGMTPWGGGYGYAEKAAVINAGVRLSKSINFSEKYKMPIEVGLLSNPDAKRTYFILKLSVLSK